MPGYARKEIVREGEVGVYHCIARCVRRAFLFGHAPVSGNDYEHRKKWLQWRLEELAGIFGVEVVGYAILSNHLHVILRTRPDVDSVCEFGRRFRRAVGHPERVLAEAARSGKQWFGGISMCRQAFT